MMRYLIACLLLLMPFSAKGATVAAASAAYADVAAAVASANTGDTVTVPAGTPTWTTQLTMSKAITVRGAGSSLTVIKNGIHVNDWHGLQPCILVTTAAGNNWRITSMGFDGQWTAGGKGIVVTGSSTGGRVDHCYFERCYDRGIQTFSLSWGLIDHCTFKDCFSSASFYGQYWDSWALPLNIGTTNCWVMEDCYDLKTGAYFAPIGSDGDWGARYTFRNNVLSNIGLYNFDYMLDAHGNQEPVEPGYEGHHRGTVFVESYNNRFSAVQANRGNALRGGTQLHYNNTFVCGSGNFVAYSTVFLLTEEDGYRYTPPLRTVWPGYDGHTNSYYWQNSFNGAVVNGVVLEKPTDPTFIALGRDYWLNEPSTNFYRPLSYPHPRVVADNDPAIPAAFALVSPAPAATGVSIEPTLQWADSDIETGYVIQIASDVYFSTNVYTGTAAQNATTKAIPGGTLAINTPYYWKVLAAGANGTNTSTGPTRWFTTGSDTAVPGSLAFTSAIYTVNENAGTVTISASRAGGTDGAVTLDIATVDGTAIAGVNYVSTNKTLSWGNGVGGAQTVQVEVLVDAVYTGDLTLTVTASNPTGGALLGTPTTTTITIVNTDSPPVIPLMSGLTFHAYEGRITSIFGTNASGYVRQVVDSDAPGDGGLVAWRVTIPATADYTIAATVDAPTTAANSFFVDFDVDPPATPTAIWDITTLTSGLESRPVGWRGTGTALPQFPTNVWTLSAGVHTLYIRGREANTLLDEITITADTPSPVLAWGLLGMDVMETVGSATFTIVRQGDTNGTVSVNYATANDTATAPRYYTATSGIATFLDGVTSANVSVPIVNNTCYTAYPRLFTLTLSSPSGAVLSENPTAECRITGVLPAPRRARVTTIRTNSLKGR